MTDTWCERLRGLMTETCATPPRSEARRQWSDRLIRHLQSRNIPYFQSYERDFEARSPEAKRKQLLHQEAASQTWLHFLKNLCECQTRNTRNNYVDQDCLVVVRRLRKYYFHRLLDLKVADWKTRQEQFMELDEEGNIRSIEEILATPLEEPDWFDELCQWLQSDKSDILRQTHLRDKLHINAQKVLVRRFCVEVPWAAIAEEFGVSQGTLATFFTRRCLPLVRQFHEDQGYTTPVPPMPMQPENSHLQLDMGCWLETDPTGVLRQTQMTKYPEITAQLVLLREFKSQDKLKTVIEAIAQEQEVEIAGLKAFYYRKCKPLVIQFGKHQGYVEKEGEQS